MSKPIFRPDQTSVTNSNIMSDLPKLSLLQIIERNFDGSIEEDNDVNAKIYTSYRQSSKAPLNKSRKPEF